MMWFVIIANTTNTEIPCITVIFNIYRFILSYTYYNDDYETFCFDILMSLQFSAPYEYEKVIFWIGVSLCDC